MVHIERGQIKAGKGALIGNSGEYFVMGELLRRGIVSGLAPRNTPGFDIIAINKEKSANIRVKSRTSAADSWAWMAKKDGSIFRDVTTNDFSVLVDLKTPDEDVDYYIIATRILDAALEADFQRWVHKPGRNGRPHDSKNKVRRCGDWHDYSALLVRAHRNWTVILDCLGIEASRDVVPDLDEAEAQETERQMT